MRRSLRRPVVSGVLLFGLGFAYLASFARYGVNWIDEGFALNAAQRIVDGEVLYRDFFSPYGPGRHHLLALAFRVFGSSLLVARLSWLALVALTAVLMYRIGLRFLPPAAALAAAACFLLAPMQAYKVFAPGALLLIALAAIRACERSSPRAWLAAGLAVGAAAAFRYELAAAGLTVAGVTLLLCGPRAESSGRLRCAAAVLAGAALVGVPLALWIASTGDLREILAYEWVQREQLLRFFALPPPSPLAGWRADGAWGAFDAAAAYVPALLALGFALRAALHRSRGIERSEDAALLATSLAGLALVGLWVGRADFDHLLHAMPVAYLLLARLACGAPARSTAPGSARAGRAVRWALTAACAAFALLFVASASLRHPSEGWSIGRVRIARQPVSFAGSGRAAYFDTPYQARVARAIASFVEPLRPQLAPDAIAFLPFGGFWYFALELRSPLHHEPLSTFSLDPRTPGREDAVIAALDAGRVEWVVLEQAHPELTRLPDFRRMHPQLWEFLEQRFPETGQRLGEWSLRRYAASHPEAPRRSAPN